jgi:adenylate/guanylate cyclase family protein/SAM (Sterile alpha motif) domain-containing protein
MRNPLGGRDAADCRLARKARPFREYAARFAENRIDFSVLRDLTDQDLKDLSVVLGDRRKMLRAIGELDAASPAAPATSTGLVSQDAAERRQVTVMFSDLVGSTALSARMDPEDLREVISAYQKCVAETVRRFGGFVAKYMGDGVLVYFGYPQAHEDDAERAVRAGLKLIAAVSALKSPVSLQTRVGISTGLVVVGDLIGSGEAQEDAADANIVVFSATDSATEAQEDANLGHGIFTYALAEGLNGKADLMNKGAVRADSGHVEA